MRKILFVSLIMVFIYGCGADIYEGHEEKSSKLCKIEVLSAQDNTLLATSNEQKTVKKFIGWDKWEQTEEIPKDLVPQYKLVVYQEKTLLFGHDPHEKREYEIIENITTYQDSSYIEVSISADAVKNIKVPKGFLTQYYIVSDETMSDLKQLLP